MKTKTSKKYLNANFKNKIAVGYCDLQTLLRFSRPNFYMCSETGWDCDIYIYDLNTVIVTGNRPYGNIYPHYSLIKKYEEWAKNKRYHAMPEDISSGKLQKIFENMLGEFVHESIKGGIKK